VLGTGFLRLSLWATIFQEEAVAWRAALEWCQGRPQEGGGIIASHSRSALANVLSQRRLPPVMAESARRAGGHQQGIPGNEEADHLNNLAVEHGFHTHASGWAPGGADRGFL